MGLFSPEGLEYSPSNLVRGAFVILAFKLIAVQLLIGCAYFVIIDWSGLASTALDWERFAIFSALQGFQILLSLYFFLQWFNRSYDITDKEVACHRGIFMRKSDYYSLERLESASLKQGVIGMIFNFGSIRITMHHSDHRDSVMISNIPKPRKQIRAIEKNLRDHSNVAR